MATPVRTSFAALATGFWHALPGRAQQAENQVDPATLETAHRAYLRDSALQLTRPELEETRLEPSPPPDWLQALGRFLDSLGPLFQAIFWIAVILVAAGIVWFLFGEAIRMRLGWQKKPKAKREDDILPDIRPDAGRARSLLEEADALAREGRFAEAVHLLLFRSIEDIQERLEGGVAPSLTAREIATLGRLPERARRALRPIIGIVEQSFFGSRPVDAAGWQAARDSYEDFAFGEGWA
ncbi:DUF4129 domain-containing protein [Hyphomonas sp.]|uniref:DUF4129 domain-containing protein n=1 Tax=Hyphomonas sp. TaxID=87 RepID=UPI003919C8ED